MLWLHLPSPLPPAAAPCLTPRPAPDLRHGRRRPAERPQQDGEEEDSSRVKTVSEFADVVGPGCAQIGLFFQGLCGGLAAVCFFITYLLDMRWVQGVGSIRV